MWGRIPCPRFLSISLSAIYRWTVMQEKCPEEPEKIFSMCCGHMKFWGTLLLNILITAKIIMNRKLTFKN